MPDGSAARTAGRRWRRLLWRGVWTVVAAASAVFWLLGGALAVYGWRHGERPEPVRLVHPQRLMVVAPHPDDEMVTAGGLLLQNVALGGVNRVVYLTNGDAYVQGRLARLYAGQRRREARAAMKAVGVPPDQMHFVGEEDRFEDLTPAKSAAMARAIGEEVRGFRPTWVITTAYEGGHCQHDLANVLTARAMTAHPDVPFYEATAYNPYFGLENAQKIAAPLVNPALTLFPGKPVMKVAPAFVPGPASARRRATPVYRTRLTKKESRKKVKVLGKYASQNIRRSLVNRFGQGEVFRPYPGYDYTQPPFDPDKSVNYRLCDRWLGGTRPGRWVLGQFGTPARSSLPDTLGGTGTRPEPDPRRCERYSVCRITHREFLDKLPQAE